VSEVSSEYAKFGIAVAGIHTFHGLFKASPHVDIKQHLGPCNEMGVGNMQEFHGSSQFIFSDNLKTADIIYVSLVFGMLTTSDIRQARHDGTLDIKGKVEKGTAVTVSFPNVEA
jgi:hypothetical protein